MHVLELITGGNAPPLGTTVATPGPRAIGAGGVVRVVSPAAPDAAVAEQLTDERGEARFAVPPGSYWVLMPWADPPGAPQAISLGIVVEARLPTGQRVLAWVDAAVPPTGLMDVTLTYTVRAP